MRNIIDLYSKFCLGLETKQGIIQLQKQLLVFLTNSLTELDKIKHSF